MTFLFDGCVPHPLRRALPNFAITTAQEMRWEALRNGDLLAATEGAFDVLVTADKNMRFQQNLSGRRIGVIVLPTNHWPTLQTMIAEIASALSLIRPGE